VRNKVAIFFKYYVFWIVFFIIQKPLFMLWQHRLIGDARAIDWLLVPFHGLPLDLCVASYIMAIMGLLLCVSCWVPSKFILQMRDVLTGIVLFVSILVMLGDNACFPSWGYHLNRDVFTYLASPKEALACAPWWIWTLGILALAILWGLWWWIYKVLFHSNDAQWLSDENGFGPINRVRQTAIVFCLTILLFLPIRGSWTVSTMNTGRVYYSEHRILNLAAVNPLFNIVESMCAEHSLSDVYCYMSSADAQNITDDLFLNGSSSVVMDTILATNRPDIVLIILESFTQNAVDAGATPNLSSLAQEGVYFSNMYAASYRTDRGIVALLSGFPGCAAYSIMRVPDKSAQLPQIGQVLKKEGYQLKFFYGGDEDFTNMRSYLLCGGFENRIADRDFDVSDRLTKWGVPDHILFSRASKEISHRSVSAPPSFDVLLSLSSHEPFEVPYQHFQNKYLNAVAYTDSCLGAFVDSLRLSPRWDKTLVVMVADHGFPYPYDLQGFSPSRYRIPFVLAGGAVKGHREIITCCQQVDWIPTILNQMNLDASEFVFAKDVLNQDISPFAYYHFMDGFALIKDSTAVIYDAAGKNAIEGNNSQLLRQAQAVSQIIMETINNL